MSRILGLPSIRSAASFAGGAIIALVGSRLLPPLMAQLRGARRVEEGGDPLASLLLDHRVIMSHLDAMVDSADSETFVREQRLLRLKRRLAAHAMAEEDVVYPTLRAGSDDAESATHLYNEHAEMKVLLYKLEQTPKDEAQWHVYALELRSLVEKHIQQEEEVDFPRLRAALGDAESLALASKIEREKALLL